MEVKIAQTAGFCNGVSRAVNKVYEAIRNNNGRQIYTLGPLVHNEQVMEDLQEKGVRIIHEPEEVTDPDNSLLIIRSHGVARSVYEKIQSIGIEYIDTTCAFVLKIHRLVEEHSRNGEQIVVIGDKNHPEVIGICGWSHTPATVLHTEEEVYQFSPKSDSRVCIFSQTTFNHNKFQELVEIFKKMSYSKSVINTICNATEERQCEAKAIAASVDTMLVIGSRHSSNTRKLFEICRNECLNTYYVQTLVDLDSEMFRSSSCVGITAGASTPNKIIEEVLGHVRAEL